MEKARTVIVGGIVTAVLMMYRTKTATSWTDVIRRRVSTPIGAIRY
jgi:hypothetical protein